MAKGIIEHVPWLIQACDQGCPSMGLQLYNLEAKISQPVNDGGMFSPY